jgi:hypothetical protein
MEMDPPTSKAEHSRRKIRKTYTLVSTHMARERENVCVCACVCVCVCACVCVCVYVCTMQSVGSRRGKALGERSVGLFTCARYRSPLLYLTEK